MSSVKTCLILSTVNLIVAAPLRLPTAPRNRSPSHATVSRQKYRATRGRHGSHEHTLVRRGICVSAPREDPTFGDIGLACYREPNAVLTRTSSARVSSPRLSRHTNIAKLAEVLIECRPGRLPTRPGSD
jgi:hypothetical protein